MGSRLPFLALLFIAGLATPALARDDKAAILSFEACGGPGGLALWNGEPSGPPGTLFIDTTVVHGGRYAGRIERSGSSAATFSSFALPVPLDFTGDTLEVRGWLRFDAVVGFAGLWQRQDSPVGMVQFDNMSGRQLGGTREWQEYSVRLPLDKHATKVVVGALIVGQGRLWVDDLRLFVDGRPIAEAPEWVRPKTALDLDHEFDHGSRIADTTLTATQIANLALLGKTWGFLKYHHPRVVSGGFHWDYELFRVLPSVLAARDRATAQAALSRWVKRLGPIAPCTHCPSAPRGRPVQPKLGWLSDRALLGEPLALQLQRVYANRDSVAGQFYVSLAPGVGNPDFSSELEYPDSVGPDAGFRLLAVYRWWNIVQYWSPYRDVAEQDWDAVLREFIPRALARGTRDDYKLTMLEMIARLNDGHANLWRSLRVRPPRGDFHVPVTLRFLGDTLVVTGNAHRELGTATRLAPGDIIRAIDGVPVESLVARWRPYYAASNEAARRRDMATGFTAGDSGSVSLLVDQAGEVRTRVVSRAHVSLLDLIEPHDHRGETFRRLSPELAYLKLSSVKVSECSDYIRKAQGASGLIIDLRNYPSEFVVFALGQHLLSQPTLFTVFTSADPANPGSFTWTEPLYLTPSSPRFEGGIAILVDETTQSQAEYTTMAFRVAPGAVVVGSTTAGADGNVSRLSLPGGLQTMISGIGVYYPDRRPTQRLGIVPDLVVRPTVAGIRAGRDEVLEAAVLRILRRPMTSAERAALVR